MDLDKTPKLNKFLQCVKANRAEGKTTWAVKFALMCAEEDMSVLWVPATMRSIPYTCELLSHLAEHKTVQYVRQTQRIHINKTFIQFFNPLQPDRLRGSIYDAAVFDDVDCLSEGIGSQLYEITKSMLVASKDPIIFCTTRSDYPNWMKAE